MSEQSNNGEKSGPNTPVTPRVGQLKNTPPVKAVRRTPPPATSLNTLAAPKPPRDVQGMSKYSQLLEVIEDIGNDIRPTYAGNKSSSERLKRGIAQAKLLVRECLIECSRNARS